MILALAFSLSIATGRGGDPAAEWGSWRGPLGTGEAPLADPPIRWSETQNLRWKTALDGEGHSSPVVWGERVFLTAAVAVGEELEPRPSRMEGAHDNTPVTRRRQFVVRAFERATGKAVWTRAVGEGIPTDTAHESAGFASASPVTDGEHLFASFGSAGLYALDLSGEVSWAIDLGDMQIKHSHGEGAGPALFADTLVVNWDHEGDSFVVALDKCTGEERWRRARDEPTSWATPLVVAHADGALVIVPGSGRLRAYDLDDGTVVWSCGGLSENIVASPVAAAGLVVAGSSYARQGVLAVRLASARGDLTEGAEGLLWSRRRRAPYVPSPLLYRGVLYNLQHYQPLLCRTELASGEEAQVQRLELSNLYASPVAAAGRIYLTDLDGATLVLDHAPLAEAPSPLALNLLDDSFSASAAIVGRELFLRGDRWLYCLARD
ncbi:MAG: PQQ-binding-like beta-propeller repeat protein [Planctomycetota bacterium]|jgi:outer membrane protein assembly factor BamB|nr:PQQ-binding-like beta-propeller repeat protein [Planctomycetota bacterium]MDP6989205.1 PQQ-binding-like beta-propeller repeat protein [Planctomycetota bacterium]